MPTVPRTTPKLPDVISVAAVAEVTGLTAYSVRRLIAQGILPAYRVGHKQIRVRVEDVNALFVRIPTGDAA